MKAFASKSISKSCNLVPLPSHIINGCFDRLLPIITSIVNLSLATGVMPESLRLAKRRPSLKKPDADHEEYVSFRPTLNRPMVSKLKVMKRLPGSDQVTRHVLIHLLDESLESAYEMFCWTETVLVTVQNDVPCAIDCGHCYSLLLDPSAAFDTVFTVKGIVVDWSHSCSVSYIS